MAERRGFEPPVGFYPYNGLANRRLQPTRPPLQDVKHQKPQTYHPIHRVYTVQSGRSNLCHFFGKTVKASQLCGELKSHIFINFWRVTAREKIWCTICKNNG